MSLLIVDDDRDLANSLSILLGLSGHEMSVAYNARQALSKFATDSFDYVLMDVQLPDRTGFELVPELLRLQPDAEVILMTAYLEEGGLRRAYDAGAAGLVRKPLEVDELTAIINMVAGGVVPLINQTRDDADALVATLKKNGYAVRIVRGDANQLRGIDCPGGVGVVVLDLTPRLLDAGQLADALVGYPGGLSTIVVAGPEGGGGTADDRLSTVSITACFARWRGEQWLFGHLEKAAQASQ